MEIEFNLYHVQTNKHCIWYDQSHQNMLHMKIRDLI